MKRAVCSLVFIISMNCFSQSEYKNSIKFNVLGPITRVYSGQYERQITNKWSINNTLFYRQKSLLPLGVQIDSLAKQRGLGLTGIKFQYLFMSEARVGIIGYSPEIRYYFGEKKNRVFLSLFSQFEKIDMTVPALLPVQARGQFFEIKTPITFTFNTLSGGLMIGKQWKWERLGLDFVIFGPHFGFANKFYGEGNNDLISKLTESEKQAFKDKIIDRFGLSDKYFSLEITESKAEIKNIKNVPYFGIRGFGLNLYYTF